MSNTIKRSNPFIWLLDPLQASADRAQAPVRFSGRSTYWLLPIGIGVGALVITFIGAVTDREQFFFSYLVAWTFCLSLAIGGLFFVLIQHLTRARWSVVVRRIPEALIWSFPLLVFLGLPLLWGMHDLYHWTHHELFDPASPTFDPVLAGKASYLNLPFFYGRIVFYFSIWSYISWRLYTLSVRQDVDNDTSIPGKQRFTSAWGLAVTAVTTAFASFDILMSLEPHWFSTIFGVYFFSGSFMVIMAFIILVAMILQKSGSLTGIVTTEHYQDLGKFLFGFIVFWAYIAFSQYMLIWYGNLPEETIFYRTRLENGWEDYSSFLLYGHFVIPFIILLSRGAKRTPSVLAAMCIWMLAMHWFDLFWIVMPVLHETASIHLLDISSVIGLFGIVSGVVLFRLSRHSLIPERDPRLRQSLSFLNT